MFSTQDNLIDFTRRYKTLQRELKETGEKIGQQARILLSELQKIDGWECMIKECKEHYARYPKEFFGWCSVTHTTDAVQFVKGYNGGDEYEVIEISFRKSLKQQVRERLEMIEDERRKKETDEREKDLIELERLKKKYNL